MSSTTLLPSPLLLLAESECSAALDEYRCPICFALMLEPRLLPGCSARHSFCAPCIALWFELQGGSQRSCPIDRRELAPDEEPVVDVVLEAAMLQQLVRCPNAKLGCKALFPLREGNEHLLACGFRTMTCPHCKKPVGGAEATAITETKKRRQISRPAPRGPPGRDPKGS